MVEGSRVALGFFTGNAPYGKTTFRITRILRRVVNFSLWATTTKFRGWAPAMRRTGVMEYRAGSSADQLILAPENLITLAHFSVYAAMNVPKSAGELANTV